MHVSSLSMLHSLIPSDTIPSIYSSLVHSFWPGPLTLLFPLPDNLFSKLCTASQKTIGIRMPSHPVARALIDLAQRPIAAPSANTSGRPSPTSAGHVLSDMSTAGKSITVVDGGSCGVGLESTVVDGLSTPGTLKVLRPGGIGPDALAACLNEAGQERVDVQVYGRDWTSKAEQQAPSTPGMKYRHYAPDCAFTCIVPSKSSNAQKLDFSSAEMTGLLHLEPSRLNGVVPSDTRRFSMGPRDDTEMHARRLFQGLRTLEEQGCKIIYLECPEEGSRIWDDGVGFAVKERASKAAGGRPWVQVSTSSA